VLESKPVYIFLPLDMVSEPVDAKRLETHLNLAPPKDDEVEDDLVTKILDALYAAKNPMILVDILTARFHCTPEVRQLIEITQLPVFLDLAPC
jgi:pyruvate decarboxylase